MKKTFVLLGVIALSAVLFSLAACGGNGSGPPPPPPPNEVEPQPERPTTDPGTGPNLTGLFPRPEHRRALVTSFTSANFNGAIQWRQDFDGYTANISASSNVFQADQYAFIDAVVTLTAIGGYTFSLTEEGLDFYYFGSWREEVLGVPTATSVTVVVSFNPIETPTLVSSWWRAHGDEGGQSGLGYPTGPGAAPLNPGTINITNKTVTGGTAFYWVHFYDDGTFCIVNNRHNKGGRYVVAEGYYTNTGTGLNEGDTYEMTLTLVEAWGAAGQHEIGGSGGRQRIIVTGENVNSPWTIIDNALGANRGGLPLDGPAGSLPDPDQRTNVDGDPRTPGPRITIEANNPLLGEIVTAASTRPSDSPFPPATSDLRFRMEPRWVQSEFTDYERFYP
ncbi:MAG: hypothetical protein FWG89_02765 [Treponema sp.]|nr:hypothetical protein [Treponema sp.]